MLGIFDRFERFLCLDRFTGKSELMRARAVYMMGLAFIATQLINLGTMLYSYGGLTFDHLISTVVCGLVALNIVSLRFSKNFDVYAFIYSVLIIVATLSSALNQSTGINSALIPFFILGVVVNGFISGWKAAVMFGLTATTCIWALWVVSAGYNYTPIFDVEQFADRNFQRAVQASLATVLITMVVGFFSKNMHEAFGELETGILKAQDSDRAKTDFLATMSHELCTPMNGIIGMNDILEDTELDEDQKELTAIIRESGRDLQNIIGNVLLFSQLDAGRVSLDDTPFDIRSVVNAVAGGYQDEITQKGLTIETFVADSVPASLIGDEGRTKQIICTLINNAVKFTEAGQIKLALHGGADAQGLAALLLSVSDTGIGIAEADQERIFERFTQEDGSIKRRYGGTGLGLTVARGLAELMGGTLNVKSQQGVGSVFMARLAFEADIPDVRGFQEAAE